MNKRHAIALGMLSASILGFAPAAKADLKGIYEGARGAVVGLTGGEYDSRAYKEGTFNNRERDIIIRGILGDDYEQVHGKKAKKQKQLPPGLQKKLARGGDLPPGWQKKFQRGEVIDSGVYRAGQRLPGDILRQIRNIDGTEIILIDGKVARVLRDSRLVVDVIDILTGR